MICYFVQTCAKLDFRKRALLRIFLRSLLIVWQKSLSTV